MLEIAVYAIIACTAAIASVVTLAVGQKQSIGLPVAYIITLALIHIPGAVAYVASDGAYAGVIAGGDFAAIGIYLTAVGMWSFTIGLIIVNWNARKKRGNSPSREGIRFNPRYAYFCLAAGWFVAFAATPLTAIPTLGALIVYGSAIWVLGVILGLWRAWDTRNMQAALFWFAALMVYPSVILMFGGFLSYGSTVVIIVLSALLIKIRRVSRALAVLPIVGFLGISVFVNYFDDRNDLRSVAWSSAGVEDRASAVVDTFSGFRLFDVKDPGHLGALAERLNQNELVGYAYRRLQTGQVQYLYGRSFYEGAISIIPRSLWPDKPVYGGSPVIVSEMTGLRLNKNTSWGVGNVMEFYINFGFYSLIPAFLILGMVIGWLDRKTSIALENQSYARAVLYFLPAVALIQPNGSMVELASGAFAALLSAHFWLFLWRNFIAPIGSRTHNVRMSSAHKYRV